MRPGSGLKTIISPATDLRSATTENVPVLSRTRRCRSGASAGDRPDPAIDATRGIGRPATARYLSGLVRKLEPGLVRVYLAYLFAGAVALFYYYFWIFNATGTAR